MSNREICLHLGLSENYISVQKYGRVRTFRYIMMAGNGNYIEGHKKFITKFEDLIQKVIDFSYTFENEHQFAKWLSQKGFYSTVHSALLSMNSVLYNSRMKNRHWRGFRKLNKIIKEIENERD